MNHSHAQLCASPEWARYIAEEVLPRVLDGLDLGACGLEVGPGYGPTTRALARRVPRLTAVEIDRRLATALHESCPDVYVVCGDGTRLPFPADQFSAVVCFTMLHHLASPAAQDAFFAEAARVLAPNGLFAGWDGTDSSSRREFHHDDVFVPVDPAGLPDRLRAAGFVDVTVTGPDPDDRFSFVARQPVG